jgi:hypothetical protein
VSSWDRSAAGGRFKQVNLTDCIATIETVDRLRLAGRSWVAPIGCIHVLECRWARLIVLHTVAHTLKAYLCVSMQPVKDTFMPQSPTTSTDVGSASSLSKHCKLLRLVAVLCTAGFVAHAQAVPSLDASNDFLPNYAARKTPTSTCCRPTW